MEPGRVPPQRILPDIALEEHAYAMETRGYNVIADFLDPAHCERLKAALARALDAYQPREKSFALALQFRKSDVRRDEIVRALQSIIEDLLREEA